jgi:anti-anti-sigma factor
MRRPLRVEVIRTGTDVVVSGRLDTLSCDELRTALQTAVAEGDGDLVVHAEGLEIWGAPALGVLIGASRAARRRDRRMVVAGLAARELRLFRAGHLDRLVVIAPPSPLSLERRPSDARPA